MQAASPFAQQLDAAIHQRSEAQGLATSTLPGASPNTHEDFYVRLFTQSGKWSAAEPNEDEAARWARIEPLVQEITGKLPDYDPARFRILDLGCGRGWLTNLLSRYGVADGVEPVARVVEHAQAMFPKLRLLAGDAHTVLNHPEFEPYDLVVSSEVLEHIPDSDKPGFAAGISRLLKPGGGLVITTPRGEVLREWTLFNGDPSQPVEDWLTETRVSRLFGDHGLCVRRCERVWFDTEARAFVSEGELRLRAGLIALYQVWSFKLAGGSPLLAEEGPCDPDEVLIKFFRAQDQAAARARDTLPDHPALLAAQAQALLGLGRWTEARDILARAVALHADEPTLRRLFAAVLRHLGDDSRSGAHLARACALENFGHPAPESQRFIFLDHLAEAKLATGLRSQVEQRMASINSQTGLCIYLHPPAQLVFSLPTARAGQFNAAIAIQPQAWHQPRAGGCEFILIADGKQVFAKTINPTANEKDRAWHEVSVAIPALASGQHEIALATRAVGSPPDFRWALWRQPIFA